MKTNELPDGWKAPRREFLVNGIGREAHFFQFDAKLVPCTHGRVEGGPEAIWEAECVRCKALVPPELSFMREHALLHVAVELSVEKMSGRAIEQAAGSTD